ncbi:MAG TPA: APC family permease [Bryobacteraceae bacterium]|nr:APC family permease [Bryobacteraceae bacterium]
MTIPTARHELRLRDVVFFDICAVISLRWVAAAAHAGPGSMVLWIIAAAAFFLPSAVVIARLSQQFPEGGGLYAWTKRAFGDRHAFICGWLYFISTILYFPSLLLAGIGMTTYALGGERLADQRTFVLPVTLLVLWAMFTANFFGLRVAKWIGILGGSSTFVIGALLTVVCVAAYYRFPTPGPLFAWPTPNLDTVNFWSQIAFAFVGLELVSLVSGEVRNPRRDLPRAAFISGIISVLFYIAVTASLLAVLRPQEINPMTGLAQAAVVGAHHLRTPGLALVFGLLMGFALLGQVDTWIAGNTRVPYVVGVDNYLPAAFKRTHPRWGTPYVSLLVQAVLATAFLLMAQLGETVRAAYQIMVDMMIVATFIPFLYIFGAGFRFTNRIAAIFGLTVTLIAIVLSAVPPPGIASVATFETKVLGGSALVTVAGLLLFQRYKIKAAL